MAYKNKAELLDEAEALGLVVEEDMTREELIGMIEDAEDQAQPGAGPAEAGGNLGFPGQPGEAPPG